MRSKLVTVADAELVAAARRGLAGRVLAAFARERVGGVRGSFGGVAQRADRFHVIGDSKEVRTAVRGTGCGVIGVARDEACIAASGQSL